MYTPLDVKPALSILVQLLQWMGSVKQEIKYFITSFNSFIPICQILLRTARHSYEAITALAMHGVILIARNADSFVTTRRTVRLTGTLCNIIIDILVLLHSLLSLCSLIIRLVLLADRKSPRSDSLILGHCSPLMPTSRSRACKSKETPCSKKLINIEHSLVSSLGAILSFPFKQNKASSLKFFDNRIGVLFMLFNLSQRQSL